MSSFNAIGLVLREPRYRYLALALFVPALTLYLFTLPATYTGGVIGLTALQYLDAELIFFSVTLAALLGLTLALNVYAFRASVRRKGAGLSVGALLGSLLPSSVCCTSLVPSLLAVLGATTPQIFGLTGKIQGFVATYESWFLVAALALLIFSLRLSAKNILTTCAVPERSVGRHDPSQQEILS